MSIYEKTNVARALLYWAKNNNGNEAYYLEDRMYAVADGDMTLANFARAVTCQADIDIEAKG